MIKRTSTMALWVASVTLLMLAVPSPALAGKAARTLTVEIEGAEESVFSLSLSGDFVAALIDGLLGEELICDGELDVDAMAMLRHLDRRGEGSRYTLETERQMVKARRRRGQLELVVREDGAKKAEIGLPWPIAACLMGDETALRATKGDGKLRIDIEDGGALTVRID